MAEHTPGPWRWIPYVPKIQTMPRLVGAGDVEICNFGNDTRYCESEGEPPNEANARLIAAAPKLLLAVNSFRWLGNNLHNIREDPERFREFYEAALADANEAVAEVDGEGP
jgi:hypothetical protein